MNEVILCKIFYCSEVQILFHFPGKLSCEAYVGLCGICVAVLVCALTPKRTHPRSHLVIGQMRLYSLLPLTPP